MFDLKEKPRKVKNGILKTNVTPSLQAFLRLDLRPCVAHTCHFVFSLHLFHLLVAIIYHLLLLGHTDHSLQCPSLEVAGVIIGHRYSKSTFGADNRQSGLRSVSSWN